ncbi:MAG: hypothetical protein NTZ97_04210 [Candidatus Moranbacteria bacterium]|nr:hypothetical protein [Candidatus Moranbacteria bacterium]
MNLANILSQLGVSMQLTQDVSLIIFLALASFIFGMLLGRRRIMSVLVSIYIAYAIITVVPDKMLGDYFSEIIVFLILIVFLTLLNQRFFGVSFYGSSHLWRIFSLSFLQIVLVLSIIFSIMPKSAALGYVSGNTYQYLVSSWAPLIWMLAPLIFMFLIYRKGNR